MFVNTFWSLVPPIVAIGLALLTKETYSSLFIGIVVGALLATDFSPIGALDTIINDGGVLYRVVQPVTPQEHQPPHSEGMLAIYRPIDAAHAGTQEDPVPVVYGMDTEQGKYYSFEGKTYLCNLTMTPCVWAPGTPGLWQWSEVTE